MVRWGYSWRRFILQTACHVWTVVLQFIYLLDYHEGTISLEQNRGTMQGNDLRAYLKLSCISPQEGLGTFTSSSFHLSSNSEKWLHPQSLISLHLNSTLNSLGFCLLALRAFWAEHDPCYEIYTTSHNILILNKASIGALLFVANPL